MRGRADAIACDPTVPPVRLRSGGLTPPGSPAPPPLLRDVSRTGCADAVEPRVRRLVADELGVAPEDLGGDVSLADELAADSLDLLGLVLAVEAEFAVSIPESAIVDLRTYGDLVALVANAVVDGRRPVPEPDAPVWVRVLPASAGLPAVERAIELTPYAIQTISDDALHAGPGARLELDVPAGCSDGVVVAVQQRFARLGERGVHVNVRRRFGTAVVRSAAGATH